MDIIVNGQPHSIQQPSTVAELLVGMGFAGKPMLVERNAVALLAREHETTTLQSGDRLELILIVAGG